MSYTEDKIPRQLPEDGDKIPSTYIRQPRFKFIVEPIVFLFALFTIPGKMVENLLVYYFIARDIRGNRTELNISQLQSHSHCYVNKSDSVYIYREEIQKQASVFTIYQMVALALPALVLTLFLGAYSDKVGRKYALAPPLLAQCFSIAISLTTVILNLPVYLLILASFLEGCGGAAQTFHLGVLSYVADVSKPEERSFRITLIEMIMFFSTIFGLLSVGYILPEIGFQWIYVTFLTAKVVLLFLVVFALPETVNKNPDTKFFSTRHIRDTFNVIQSVGHPERFKKILVLLLALFLPTAALLGQHVEFLYLMNVPFCWNTKEIGNNYFKGTDS